MPPASTGITEIDTANAAEYVRRRFGLDCDSVTSLSGGVSNTVLLIGSGTKKYVLKQSLPQLRVAERWDCDRSRVFRESAAMKLLSPLLPEGSIPEVVAEDPDNFAFVMTAAPEGAETWKSQLMRGETRKESAQATGELLGRIISCTLSDNSARRILGDLTAFTQLRLDPYYRFVAEKHPRTTSFFAALTDDCVQRRICLVHGDWSPKNLLVTGTAVMSIDWECVHFGNPAFDAAFVLNHLLLKSLRFPVAPAEYAELAEVFWSSLSGSIPDIEWLQENTMRHWSGLLLARVDGKSPVEYITDPELKQCIRSFALDLIFRPASSIGEVFERSKVCR